MTLLDAALTDLPPAEFVARHGEVFRVFDATTQDSGNLSYGVRVDGRRLFVKTAGSPTEPGPRRAHSARVALLRTAVRIARSANDPAIPVLLNVVESSLGPLLVYEWLEGELINTPAARRADPRSAYARFVALPLKERAIALDVVFRLHTRLAVAGWIASDFYDGCFLYDFTARRMRVIDLDHYRGAPFVNEMGRMFGSTRFMAPEEFERGARIDERTTVFNMGRAVEQFMVTGGALHSAATELCRRACDPDPRCRFGTMEFFYHAWAGILGAIRGGSSTG